MISPQPLASQPGIDNVWTAFGPFLRRKDLFILIPNFAVFVIRRPGCSGHSSHPFLPQSTTSCEKLRRATAPLMNGRQAQSCIQSTCTAIGVFGFSRMYSGRPSSKNPMPQGRPPSMMDTGQHSLDLSRMYSFTYMIALCGGMDDMPPLARHWQQGRRQLAAPGSAPRHRRLQRASMPGSILRGRITRRPTPRSLHDCFRRHGAGFEPAGCAPAFPAGCAPTPLGVKESPSA
jgi:hypothetical protein